MLHHLLLPALLCLAVPTATPAQKTSEGKQRPVADLVADLKKGEQERTKALLELEALGAKAAPAIPALVELMAAKDEFTRLQATIALGKIGKPAVAPLTRALASADEDMRFYAAWGLALVGAPARPATPALAKALADKSPQVRRKAAYALGRIDPEPAVALPILVGALEDGDADVRLSAASALQPLGKAAVPPLLKTLTTTAKVELRNLVLKTLGELGAVAAPTIPELKTFLEQPAKGAQEAAADALASIGAPAIPTLTAAAADDSDKVRALAVGALHKIGAPAVPALVDLLGGKHADVRRQSAHLLGTLPVRDKMVVIGLGYALKDQDVQVRRHALKALRSLGSSAKLAAPYVSPLLVDPDPLLRVEAFHTLTEMDVDVRPALKKALAHKDPDIRIPTAGLMVTQDVAADLAEPVLVAALKEPNEALKVQAAHALSQRGLQADVVLPVVTAGMKNELAGVRQQAAEAIARYGAKARAATAALVGALDDPDDGVRLRALVALRQVAEPKGLLPVMLRVLKGKDANLNKLATQVVFQVGPDAVGALVAALQQEKTPALRLVCLQTLAMVGPRAKEAVPELIRALADDAAAARMSAARALGNIGPDAKAALAALAKTEMDKDDHVKKIARAAKTQINADPTQKVFEVQGVITAADPFDRVRQEHHAVVYTYSMKAGRTYTLNLRSSWDNWMRLEDPRGKEVAFDDDSGGDRNARIVYQAKEDGWHRIVVISYAAGPTWTYLLKVE